MKNLKASLVLILFLFIGFVAYQSDSVAQGLENDGKKCKTDKRCPLSTYTECDEFGDGTECVCFVCGSNNQE